MNRALPISILVGALGCASALVHPTDADAVRVLDAFPGTTVQDLERGRDSYVAKCSGCHALILPGTRPGSVWRDEVHEMAARAALTEAQTSDITRYLVAMAPPG